ncbi:MAG: hydroxyacylglutathione hydrolase [Psychrobacter glaciei]|jgi:hydroxyacylglutathione hydrolase
MFNVTPIPIIEDNYAWLVQHQGQTLIVDPGEAAPVIAYLQEHSLKLNYMFVTHKHWDHITGIAEIKAAFPDCIIYGTGHHDIPCREIALMGGETLELMGLSWKVWHTPGHTLDHIVFYTETSPQQDNGINQGHLFSGDNLFACGCGRMFEGTAEQFEASLASLVALPVNTKIYCTHEYTLANINFALHIEPNNTYTLHRQDVCTQLRQQGLPTVPTTVSDELKSNPFVRLDQPDVIRAAEHFSGRILGKKSEVFAVIRKIKDSF